MVSVISVVSGTRAIGLLGYAAAFAACAFAWQKRVEKKTWLSLTLIQLLLLFDLVFNWRWEIHDRVVNFAVADNVYDERRWPQKVVLALEFVTMIVLALRLWRRFRRRGGTSVAIVATVLSVALRLTELISWHKSDTILHWPLGGAMVISFLWFGLGIATVIGAWLALYYPTFSW